MKTEGVRHRGHFGFIALACLPLLLYLERMRFPHLVHLYPNIIWNNERRLSSRAPQVCEFQSNSPYSSCSAPEAVSRARVSFRRRSNSSLNLSLSSVTEISSCVIASSFLTRFYISPPSNQISSHGAVSSRIQTSHLDGGVGLRQFIFQLFHCFRQMQ